MYICAYTHIHIRKIINHKIIKNWCKQKPSLSSKAQLFSKGANGSDSIVCSLNSYTLTFPGALMRGLRRLSFLTFNWGVKIKLPVSGTWVVVLPVEKEIYHLPMTWEVSTKHTL